MTGSHASSSPIEIRFNLALGEPATDTFTLDVDTTIAGQGITAIVGPSGSGKTTLLRCIAGLLHAQEGDCSVAGQCWQRAGLFLATHKRPLGYVFQEASLLAHLTAQGNLDYAMKRAHRALPEGFADQVIEIMGIGALLSRMPHQLSGGERQRVAIARALLVAPSLLLMDEPLASLDTARKQEILPYLERLHETVQTPVLYVSHSMDEVARIADDVVVLDAGRIHTQGKLETVFSQLNLPLNTADETATIHTGRIVERDTQWHLSRLELADGQNIWTKDDGDKLGQDVRLRILARDVSLSLNDVSDTSILNRLRVQVTQIAADHDEAMALVQLTIGAVTSNEILIARITQRSVAHLDLKAGQVLWAQIKSVAVVR